MEGRVSTDNGDVQGDRCELLRRGRIMSLKETLKRIVVNPIRKIMTPLMVPAIDHSLNKDSRDIERWRRRKALDETGRFVDEHMADIQSDSDCLGVLNRAIRLMDTAKEGLVCEFGVATGRTINHIARKLPTKTIFGFDSSEGLPEDWRDGLPKGTYARSTMPRVRDNVRLVKGLFRDTLPDFLAKNDGPALFLHVDCDLYSSTRTVLDLFQERIGPGTVIVFDEYFNYPGWQDGEFKAFREFCEKNGRTFEYAGYCRYNSQVAVKIGG